jgi:hypothetical protein
MDWKAWLVVAALAWAGFGSYWSRRRSRWQPGMLTEEQAKAIIEEEIHKRGWEGYDRRSYEFDRRKGRYVWVCWGRVGYERGGAMAIHIDARTGEIVHASAGGR